MAANCDFYGSLQTSAEKSEIAVNAQVEVMAIRALTLALTLTFIVVLVPRPW